MMGAVVSDSNGQSNQGSEMAVRSVGERFHSAMRSLIAVALLGFGAVTSASSASGRGICVDVKGHCNDYFFVLTREKAGIYSAHGYEYGCAIDAREASGVVRKANNRWYLGFTGSNKEFDYTQQVTWSGDIDAVTLAGGYNVLYTYMNGGILQAHGFTGYIRVMPCEDPGVSESKTSSLGESDTTMPPDGL